MHRDTALILRAVAGRDLARAVGRLAEGGHRRQIALLGVGCELEARPKEAALERVADDLPHRVEITGRDRRALGVVPELEPVLLNEVRIAGRLAHHLPRRLLLELDT